MDILHLIDRLETIVSQGTRVPGLGKTIIDPDQVLDIIDQMRISVPKEMQESRRIVEQREAVLDQAQTEAQMILAQAHKEIEARLDSNDMVRAARERADQIIAEAQQRASDVRADAARDGDEQRRQADDYAADVLRRLITNVSSVKGNLESFLDQMESAQPAGR